MMIILKKMIIKICLNKNKEMKKLNQIKKIEIKRKTRANQFTRKKYRISK